MYCVLKKVLLCFIFSTTSALGQEEKEKATQPSCNAVVVSLLNNEEKPHAKFSYVFQTKVFLASVTPENGAKFSWAPLDAPEPRVDLYLVDNKFGISPKDPSKSDFEVNVERAIAIMERLGKSDDYKQAAKIQIAIVRSQQDGKDIFFASSSERQIAAFVITDSSNTSDSTSQTTKDVFETLRMNNIE